jgi:hypothetical protein
MRNYQLSTAINEYPADDDVLTMLHASELVQGRRIVALYIHVSFSPDKTQAGYMLMGKMVSLNGEGETAGCLTQAPVEETSEGLLATTANNLLQCTLHARAHVVCSLHIFLSSPHLANLYAQRARGMSCASAHIREGSNTTTLALRRRLVITTSWTWMALLPVTCCRYLTVMTVAWSLAKRGQMLQKEEQQNKTYAVSNEQHTKPQLQHSKPQEGGKQQHQWQQSDTRQQQR